MAPGPPSPPEAPQGLSWHNALRFSRTVLCNPRLRSRQQKATAGTPGQTLNGDTLHHVMW